MIIKLKYLGGSMVEIEKIILHVLDCEHNTCIPSTSCMQELHPEIEKMILSKVDKVFRSSLRKNGNLHKSHIFTSWLDSYKQQALSFEDLSCQLAQYLFDKKMQYAQYQSSDCMIAIIMKEGRRYLFVLDNSYIQGITHHLKQNEVGIVNEIITHQTLLSSNLLSKDRAFVIELSDYSLLCVEQKVEIEGSKQYFIGDIVLQSKIAPSYKESVSNISKITEAMSDKYDLDEVEIIPKMKSIIVDNVEQQKPISVDEIASILFENRPLIQDDFKEEIRKQGIPEQIDVEHVKTTRSQKVQKIKTDKGIEVIIPIDYMNSKEFVEFKNQPDGTISIQLKNITHITSK